MALFWIEHDMQMVGDLADRIHVLDYGRTIADGERRRRNKLYRGLPGGNRQVGVSLNRGYV
jgi:energy-coupling factor transporter ATP-binding protein EcfA2